MLLKKTKKGLKIYNKFLGFALQLSSATNWWLRSPNTGNTNNFWYVNSNGNVNNNNANNSYGVCFDFFNICGQTK